MNVFLKFDTIFGWFKAMLTLESLFNNLCIPQEMLFWDYLLPLLEKRSSVVGYTLSEDSGSVVTNVCVCGLSLIDTGLFLASYC